MIRLLAIAAAGVLVVAGCASGGDGGADDGGGEPLTVFAAASLNEVFPELAESESFDVTYSFDGSSGLVDQLAGGAPADVLATADTETMQRAVEQGLVEGEPVAFATNRLALAVETGNPLDISSLDDLEGTRLVLCAPQVPCGRASRAMGEAEGLALSPVSEENNVSDVAGKVRSGEADAGLVYTTTADDGLELIEVPEAADHGVELWIGTVAGSDRAEDAREFVDTVAGPAGTALLGEYGFGSP